MAAPTFQLPGNAGEHNAVGGLLFGPPGRSELIGQLVMLVLAGSYAMVLARSKKLKRFQLVVGQG